jgi:hypothetical protein
VSNSEISPAAEPAGTNPTSRQVAAAGLRYAVLRLALFVSALAFFSFVGLHGFALLATAFLASAAGSYFLYSRLGGQLTAAVAGRITRRHMSGTQ